MNIIDVLLAALVVWLGTTVQTTAGFGFGLVAVPLLLGLGRPLPEAIAIVIGAGAIQVLVGIRQVSGDVRVREGVPIALAGWIGIPLGVVLMHLYLSHHATLTKQIIGGLLLALLLFFRFAKPTPRERVGVGWGLAAGASGGLLAGLSGMGGPPLVLFASYHTWTKGRFRAFLWVQFLFAMPVVIAALFVQHGAAVPYSFAFGLAMAPVAWLGTRTGFALSARWDRARLQLLANGLLYAIGLSALFGPMIAPWLSAHLGP